MTMQPVDHVSSGKPHALTGYLTREELASQLGVTPRTLEIWAVRRAGPPHVKVGRAVLYRLDAVRQWLTERESRPPVHARARRRA